MFTRSQFVQDTNFYKKNNFYKKPIFTRNQFLQKTNFYNKNNFLQETNFYKKPILPKPHFLNFSSDHAFKLFSFSKIVAKIFKRFSWLCLQTGKNRMPCLVNSNLKSTLFILNVRLRWCHPKTVKPWPNDANIFAQQMPTMLGINVGIVWPPMLGIVG